MVTVDRLGGGHGHGQRGAAVKRALKDDDVGPAGGVAGQLDGALHRLGARVGEKEGIQRPGHHLAQGLGQAQQGLMVIDVHLGVQHAGCLGGDGLHDTRMAVAGVGHANAAGKVQVAVALDVPDVDPLAPLHDHVVDPAPHRRDLFQVHFLLLLHEK